MVRKLGILYSHPFISSLYIVILAGMKFKTEEEAVLLNLTDGSFHDCKEAGESWNVVLESGFWGAALSTDSKQVQKRHISVLEALSAGSACWEMPGTRHFLELTPHIWKLNMGLQD